MSDNAQQIEYWNGAVGERWAKLQESTDRNLSAISDALMPFAAAKAGEHVLDIGCGCGTTTLALARIIGKSATVTGIDVSVPMLEVARRRAGTVDANVAFVEADAAAYAFKPEFDLVFSRFGVMFFADPVAAFTNIRGALKPAGRMAFVCWRAMPENAWAYVPHEAARDLVPPPEASDPHAPGPFAFADAQRLMTILLKAGFSNVKGDKLDTVMNMGATVDEAVMTALNIGPLARAARDVDEATRAKIAARVHKALENYAKPDGVAPPAACWLVSATA
jgi:ubiquinone/menaquinone biosynthesis C-methylase UbiE